MDSVIMTDNLATIHDSEIDRVIGAERTGRSFANDSGIVMEQTRGSCDSWLKLKGIGALATKRQCGLFPDGRPRGNRSLVRKIGQIVCPLSHSLR
jgi:hypothetical protein